MNMRLPSLYADFIKTVMAHRPFYDIFVTLIFVTTVRGLNITRCLGPYNDSYTCPGLSDPPERTHCCLWDGKSACCLPGGSSCSDSHEDKRNYCPGPNYGKQSTHCCVSDSKPACCHPEGSSCNDNADIRNYCPGADHGSERTHCCVWDNQPTCCLPGGSSCHVTDFRDYCPGPNDKKNDVDCCGETNAECCSKWNTTDWIIFGVVLFAFLVSPAVLFFFAVICSRYC